MKIALIGYGKMGKAIEEVIVKQNKHSVVLKIGIENIEELTIENLKKADVAIEFTSPHSAIHNLFMCLDAAIPVVCGSTGWMNEFEKVKTIFIEKNGTLVYASNFSIGVNLFFAINQFTASLLKNHSQYIPTIDETHHIEKKDAPSGTAISLRKIVESKLENIKVPITDYRIENVIGTHNMYYKSTVDEITITHKANSRSGFAEGAVYAAEWIVDKKGVYEFREVLGL